MLQPSEYHVSDVDGLRVVTEHVPSVRSVSIGVWIGVGSRDESARSHGYAHFVEHLLFKGNERFSAEGISNFFDGIGSDANAATTKEYTVVHSRVLDRHVETTLDVMGSMVLTPGFDEEEIESERQVILEEIAMYNDSPSDVVHEVADQLVFGEHPLGAPIVGDEQSIGGAGVDAIRSFHQRHYLPTHLVVSAAGNCEHEQFVAAVRERFLTGRSHAGPAAAPTRSQELRSNGSRAQVVRKDTEQVHLCLGAAALSRHDPRRYASAVLDTILGGTPSSRLFNEIRERRGLAYSVYSFVSHYADTGQIGIYVGVRPDRLSTTLEVLRDEIERIRTTPPSAQELARAKDHLEGRMLLSMESTTVRANRLGSSMITGMPIEPVEVTMERIRAVTPDDVRALAAELLAPGHITFAAVADETDAVCDAAERVLGLDRSLFVPGEAVAQ